MPEAHAKPARHQAAVSVQHAEAPLVKVIPRDYERVMNVVAEAEAAGKSRTDALQIAFDAMTEGE